MTREEIWNKAYKKIPEFYGDIMGIHVVNRFFKEKQAFEDLRVAEYFYELAKIRQESLEKYNEFLIVKAPMHSCLIAYLLGATDIDPIKNKIPFETYIPYAKQINVMDSVPNNYEDLFEDLRNKHFQTSLLKVGQACHLLGEITGISPNEIDCDREVKYRLLGGDFSCMHPKLAEFLKQAYTIVQPCSYAELLKLIGMAHGTQTWRNNGEDLLKNGKCRLADIPATRDEVFMMIRDYDIGLAYDVANKARKGYYFEHGMDGYTIDTLKSLGFGDWFASYLLGVRYMSTKALSILELRYIIMLTYFKLYSHEYQEVIAGEDIWQPR